MFERRGAPTWPGQTEVIAGEVVTRGRVFAAFGLEGFDIEQMHVAHVRLKPLGALAGVANGPHALVDFAQDVIGNGFVQAFDFLHLVVFHQLFVKAQLLRQLIHDHVVRAALPQRLNDLFTPLQ